MRVLFGRQAADVPAVAHGQKGLDGDLGVIGGMQGATRSMCMSVAQAEEFYSQLLLVLEEKLGPKSGRENWESIVEFMAGMKPSECPPEKREEPGTEKCIAIVYQGADAVRKSGRCSAQPIRPKPRWDRFGKSSGRPL